MARLHEINEIMYCIVERSEDVEIDSPVPPPLFTAPLGVSVSCVQAELIERMDIEQALLVNHRLRSVSCPQCDVSFGGTFQKLPLQLFG